MLRQKDMKKAALIVLVGTVGLLSVASCSSTTFRQSLMPVSTVTGFARVPVTGGGSAGPVTVRLTEEQATLLAVLVGQLPQVPGDAPGGPPSAVHCQEPLGLMYRINFGGGDGPVPAEAVEGYRCDAAVAVGNLGGPVVFWHRDANCALIQAVRNVLPTRAKATQRLAIGCDS